MSEWKQVSKELPCVGSSVIVRIGTTPEASHGKLVGCIDKIIALPLLGSPWPMGDGTFIVQWRYLQ